MALFNDGSISELADLQAQETSILDTANAEGIDLAAKLVLAQREIGVELTAFLLTNDDGALGEVAARNLSKVAVTEALRQWHVFRTLALAFRDLYHNQLNDRYGQKWKEYARLADERSRLLYESGVGVVLAPLPRAGAPVVEAIAGAASGATYFLRASWVNSAGAEGAPGAPTAFTTDDGFVPRVTLGPAPAGVTGWHLYAGFAADGVARQTDAALPPGESWTPAGEGLRAGPAPGTGQEPDLFIRKTQRTIRG